MFSDYILRIKKNILKNFLYRYFGNGHNKIIQFYFTTYYIIMFKKHLDDHWVSYRDHQRLAFFFARESLKASIMAFIHWIVPKFFETSASDVHKTILPRYKKMLEEFKEKR